MLVETHDQNPRCISERNPLGLLAMTKAMRQVVRDELRSHPETSEQRRVRLEQVSAAYRSTEEWRRWAKWCEP